MKEFLRVLAFVLMVGSAHAQSNLPVCQGSNIAAWSNCVGSATFIDGNRYVGEFKDGKLNGQGNYTFSNGTKVVGEFKDGKLNGHGTYTHADGERYVGDFKDGKYNGQGTNTRPNGDKYIGEWKDSQLNGQGTFTQPDGTKLVGEFKDGKLNGQGTFTRPDGTKYVGDFKDGKYDGQGTHIQSNGDKYIGEWKDDKRHGQGTYTHLSGRGYVGEFKDNKAHGLGTQYASSGSIINQGLYADDSFVRSEPVPETIAPSKQANISETDRLTAEVEAERKKRQELEAQLAATVQPTSPQTNAPRRIAHALVIGNAAYLGSGRLDNPVNDANAISQKLRSMGFTVTTVTDANRQRLVQSMAQFRRTAASADISLLYYAGHGVQIFGTNYILPTDVDQTDPAQATIQGVSLNSVVENFLPGKTKLVFLDACRDNALQRTNDRSVSKGLAPISAAEGTLISYATKDGQTAADGVGSKNSPFTQALLEHLNDPQDIAVVLRKVRERVMKITGGKQQPWEYGSLTGGELVLSAIKPK